MVEGKVCTYCKQPIHWPQPYIQGQKPINTDGSTHICPTQQPTTSQASPQRDPKTTPQTPRTSSIQLNEEERQTIERSLIDDISRSIVNYVRFRIDFEIKRK